MIPPLYVAAIAYTVVSIIESLRTGIPLQDYENLIVVTAKIAWVGLSVTAIVDDYLDYKRNGG